MIDPCASKNTQPFKRFMKYPLEATTICPRGAYSRSSFTSIRVGEAGDGEPHAVPYVTISE